MGAHQTQPTKIKRRMKTNHRIPNPLLAATLAAVATLILAAPPATAALAPRTDINPAVLYWQGFSLYPELDASIRGDLLSEPPRLPLADAEEYLTKFDGTFKYLRRAAQMKVPCDWGIDLSEGPEALIPNLVKIRQCANAAVTRAHYALEAGRDQEASDDLAVILVLGRNAGTDGTLVSAMFAVAVENKIIDFVARNFHAFGPPSLVSLMKQIEAAPPRNTVKQSMAVERAAFLDWYIARLEAIRAAHPGNDREALEKVRELLAKTLGAKDDTVDRIIESSGSTIGGLIAYFEPMGSIYESFQKLADTGPTELDQAAAEIADLTGKHTNLLARLIFPNIARARKTELGLVARSAMLRAAVTLRLEGEPAFQKIRDPFGDGPFTLRRLPPDSGEVGFELDSQLSEIRKGTALKFLEDQPAPAPQK